MQRIKCESLELGFDTENISTYNARNSWGDPPLSCSIYGAFPWGQCGWNVKLITAVRELVIIVRSVRIVMPVRASVRMKLYVGYSHQNL
jgi:hypothetical protein